MISIYKNTEQDKTIKKLDNIEPGTWINIVSPSEQELILYQKNWSFFRFFKSFFR